MSQLTKTTISIAGKSIGQFHSFSLSQGIYEHHHFRLSCPANAVDESSGSIFNQSKNLLGQVIIVQINAITSIGSLKFKGIITNVDAEKFSGSNGDIVISGYSATKLLESGPHCKTWEKKAVKNIIQDVLKHFPQNLLNQKIAPTFPETIAYYVQYKESAWDFICRICSTYGEWVYFDGESLLVGPPESGTSVPLIFGNNLSRFSLALQLRPPSMQVMGYDFINHQVYSSTPEGIEDKAGLKGLSLEPYKSSKGTYTSAPKQWNNNFLTNKKQLDDVVNIQAAMRSAQHVKFNGSSGHPSVTVGGKISVQGQNIFNASNEAFGNYTVISVNHYTDGQGNYNNDFIAIPEAIKVPPVSIMPEQLCETQSAMVTDNHDPKGLGRIRIKFHWMNGAEKSPWIRVTSPHGGGGKGMYFMPEIGEEVIAGFEGESALKPYVIGTVYHGKASNSYSNAGNDVKALQTRSGTKIIMNDAAGSIFIEDPSGNTMLMDGKGNININAPNNMNITVGKNMNITVGENLTTNVGMNQQTSVAKNISITAGVDIAETAGKDIIQSASGNITEFADNKMEIIEKSYTKQSDIFTEIAGKINVNSTKENMVLKSAKTVELNSGEKGNLF
jgi:type VI secretion system secreted protein VgrG